MRQLKWLAPVGCALLLAGCLAPGAPDEPARAPFTWELRACDFAIALTLADPEVVEPLLPEGFRFADRAFAGGASIPNPGSGTRADVDLAVQAWACDDGARYASVAVYVEPPEALQVGGASVSFLKLDVLHADPSVRAAWEQEGLAPRATEVEITGVPQEGAGEPRARVRLGEDGWFAFRGRGVPAARDFAFVEFSAVDGGLFVWRARFSSPGLVEGSGPIELPERGLVRDALAGMPGADVKTGRADLFGGTGVRVAWPSTQR